MGKLAFICRVCGDKADNRVCRPCQRATDRPCLDCGNLTPAIRRDGKAASECCIACTARRNAPLRKIGIVCRICEKRSTATEMDYQVCMECKQITSKCPKCNSDMPKYKKRGAIRKVCSRPCSFRGRKQNRETLRAAQRKRFENHVYKSHPNRRAREVPAYKEWRQAVFTRDNYTCQKCSARSGKDVGKTIVLHPHHIKPFATHVDLRYDVSNGVTLCDDCHKLEHEHVFIGRTKRRDKRQKQFHFSD